MVVSFGHILKYRIDEEACMGEKVPEYWLSIWASHALIKQNP